MTDCLTCKTRNNYRYHVNLFDFCGEFGPSFQMPSRGMAEAVCVAINTYFRENGMKSAAFLTDNDSGDGEMLNLTYVGELDWWQNEAKEN